MDHTSRTDQPTPFEEGRIMTTENTNNGSSDNRTDGDKTGAEKDSILANLKETGHAWLSAGSRLGDVVSDFASRLRETEDQPGSTGAHALHDPVLEKETTASRFKAASKEASEKLGGVRNTEDLKAATSGFASHAEDIFRDVAANLRQAATETKDSDSVENARSAFSAAVKSVQGSFDEAVEVVQERRGKGGDSLGDKDGNSTIEELRTRLDDLISRAGSLARKSDGSEPATGDPVQDAAKPVDPDIIEGELISEDSDGDITPETTDPKEKDN
ncbi:CGLAU_01105 family protein [Corynebacterium sp. A21]|uniref:CGLAU_01105 family protein n=1 Tax=Corynebacterium sp. A21 TaxID=3457318 RepID=UPI003FD396D1